MKREKRWSDKREKDRSMQELETAKKSKYIFRNDLRIFLKRRGKESIACSFSGKGTKNRNKNLWEDEREKIRDAWYEGRLGGKKTRVYELRQVVQRRKREENVSIRREYGGRNKEEEKSGKNGRSKGKRERNGIGMKSRIDT